MAVIDSDIKNEEDIKSIKARVDYARVLKAKQQQETAKMGRIKKALKGVGAGISIVVMVASCECTTTL